MANHRNRFPARRRFLKQSTALTATVVALPLPRLARARQDEAAAGNRKPEPAAPLKSDKRDAPFTPARRRRDTRR